MRRRVFDGVRAVFRDESNGVRVDACFPFSTFLLRILLSSCSSGGASTTPLSHLSSASKKRSLLACFLKSPTLVLTHGLI